MRCLPPENIQNWRVLKRCKAPTIVCRMCVMTRKDSEKDAERPHYYSQFWLDVAAGRRIIGTPRTTEEDDLLELEPEPEPVVVRKVGRNSKSAIAHPVIEPEVEEEEEEELDEPDEPNEPVYQGPNLNEEIEEEDLELPAIIVEEAEIPDMEIDLLPIDDVDEVEVLEPELEEEEFFEAEEEEEEEDWSARGRKKPKPGRQVKLPAKKPIKREPRRGF